MTITVIYKMTFVTRGKAKTGRKYPVRIICLIREEVKYDMGVVIWIIFIIALIVAALLVNKVQQLYMKMMGADVMFFNGKKKIIAILIIAIVLTAFVINLFGIEIPR